MLYDTCVAESLVAAFAAPYTVVSIATLPEVGVGLLKCIFHVELLILLVPLILKVVFNVAYPTVTTHISKTNSNFFIKHTFPPINYRKKS